MQEKFVKMEELFSSKFNHRRYRAEIQAINSTQTCCIPHLAIHLRDIIFTNISKSKIGNFINVDKLLVCGEQIRFILAFQQCKYVIPSNYKIYHLVSELKALPPPELKLFSLESASRQPKKSLKRQNSKIVLQRQDSSMYDYSNILSKNTSPLKKSGNSEDKRKRSMSFTEGDDQSNYEDYNNVTKKEDARKNSDSSVLKKDVKKDSKKDSKENVQVPKLKKLTTSGTQSPHSKMSSVSNTSPLTPNQTKMSPFLKTLVQTILDENIAPLQMKLEVEIKRREQLEEQVKALKLMLAQRTLMLKNANEELLKRSSNEHK